MGIHQVLVGASGGDAITDLALHHRNVFRSQGLESEVFALHFEPVVAREVRALESYDATHRSGDNVLVFHASAGEPRVHEFLMRRPERIVLVYRQSGEASGRKELVELRERVAVAIADSEYGAGELRALGYDDVRVIVPAGAAAKLGNTVPDPELNHHLENVVEGPMVLFVGELLPYEAVEQLILAFCVLQTYIEPEANLAIVGTSRLDAYVTALRRLAYGLRIQRIIMPGHLPAADLVAYYQRADVFATMSNRGGFRSPFLEAMTFDVPIVAPAAGGVPEALDDAGLLLPAPTGSTLAAEAMARVISDDTLRHDLAAAGRRRLVELRARELEESYFSVAMEALAR